MCVRFEVRGRIDVLEVAAAEADKEGGLSEPEFRGISSSSIALYSRYGCLIICSTKIDRFVRFCIIYRGVSACTL